MVRFLLFCLGTLAGFVVALFLLPVPGKTFFGKLSKLPSNVKCLIDDVIKLAVSVTKLGAGVYNDASNKASKLVGFAKHELEKLEEQKNQKDTLAKVEQKEDNKDKVIK